MKALIAVLVALGIVAALCAAVIVKSWKPAAAEAKMEVTTKPAVPEVDVLYATTALPALSMVEPRSVVLKRVPRDAAPEGYVSDSAAVVGRALASPVVEGQAFTTSVLAAKNSGINLAVAVPPGMRAVSVNLSNYESLQGLLYPGSMVDILFSFKSLSPQESSRSQKTVSLTLLRGIQVLAVGAQTIVSGDTPLLGGPTSDRREMVTVLVTPKQAELLQLAQENGNISLTMRNPMEATTQPASETQLAQLIESMGDKAAVRATPVSDSMGSTTKVSASRADVDSDANASQWQIQFIRGVFTETQSVAMPESKNP